MEKIDKILQQKKDKPGYIKHEFQDYGYRLAEELNDLKHKALYIKLAKQEKRELLEKARIFAADYYDAKSKAKVFMWKLKEIKERKEKRKELDNFCIRFTILSSFVMQRLLIVN